MDAPRCEKCEQLSAQIFSILILLSHSDSSVKKHICSEKNLKILFGLVPALSPDSRVSLFKLFCNLSSDQTIQRVLYDGGFLQFIVPLIDSSNNSAKELNYLLLALNYYCLPGQLAHDCHSTLVKLGALPSLIFHSKAKAPYKELAITNLLRICSSIDYTPYLLNCGAFEAIVEIAKLSQFTSMAFEKLSLFSSSSKVREILSHSSTVSTLSSIILDSEPETLGNIAISVQKLVSDNISLAAKVSQQNNVLSFLVDKLTRKALSTNFKLNVAKLLDTLIYSALIVLRQTTDKA